MNKFDFIKEAGAIKNQIVEWRRYLHRNPETGLDCYIASDFIKNELKKMDIEVETGFAKTGVIGIIRGKSSGKIIAIRADIDALPVRENTGLPFASEVKDKCHACGHDGHTAICLAVANIMSKMRNNFEGTIKLIFQPGEEYPGGAKIMIKDGVLENPKVDAIIGYHIFPGIDSGKFGIRYGVMTARNDEFTIKIKGPGGHGAHPDESPDPIVAAGYFLTELQTIVSRMKDPLEPLVITVGEIMGGSGYNIIPALITMKGTIRSINYNSRNLAIQKIEDILKGISVTFNLEYELEIVPGEPPLRCDEKLCFLAEKVIKKHFGQENLIFIEKPSMGVDDFAFYSEKIPAIYLRLGSRDEKKGLINPLHSPKFDFDENMLPIWSASICYIAMELLNEDF
ncbi:MAG: hypothetical protein PWQ82_1849 [Thermosediminibacterales bacterium]|nr:hypothetical protein [Thermosediminibacterales bacterium]